MASRIQFQDDDDDEEEEEDDDDEEEYTDDDQDWPLSFHPVPPSSVLGVADPTDARSGVLKTFKPLTSPQCSMDDDSSTESEEEAALGGAAALSTLTPGPPTVTKPGRGGGGTAGARRIASKQEGGIASSTSRIVSTPTSFTSSEQQPIDYEGVTTATINKRKTMIKELASKYHAECLACCRELLSLQRQWRQELQAPVPGLKSFGPLVGAEIDITEDTSPKKADVQIDITNAAVPKNKPSLNISPESSNGVSADISNPIKGQSKCPLRRHLTWRANEREALRRGLLMFGLGRSEKVRGVMRGLLKQMRHGLGDIADCCWEFVHMCGIHADEKESAYAQKLYAKAKDLGIEMGPEVSERVGQWERIEKSASVWLRRLRLLDNLGEIVRLCANPETREASYGAIDSLGDGTMPCEWWNRESDLALLAGIYKHGFGNYEAIRTDTQFAAAFGLVLDENGMSRVVAGDHVSKTEVISNNWETSPYERTLPDARLKGYPSGESEPRSNQHGLELRPSSRDEENDSSWPDSNILTRRLKRLVEHIGRLSQQVVRPEKGMVRKAKEGRIWSKREKLNFLRILLTWGLPITPGHGENVCWQFFRDHASVRPLKNKKESSLEACYEGLITEMKQILEGSNATQEKVVKKNKTSSSSDDDESSDESIEKQTMLTGVSSQAGPAVLTHKSAVRLKDRLELFSTVRQALDFFSEDWRHLGLNLNQSHDLPSWWQGGHHDRELVLGVLEHGFGNWDAIFEDTGFSFRTAADQEKVRRGFAQDGEVRNLDSWGMQPYDEDDDHVKGKGKRSATQSVGSSLMPSPKSLVKRLKFIGNALRRELNKHMDI